MKSEERKYTSIPKAIGLFMIFKALFYKDSFEGVELPEGFFYSYLGFAEAAAYYLFLIIGICLCVSQRFIFYWMAWLATAFTLFGTIHTLAPGTQNTLMTIIMAVVHLLLCFVLYWSMKMIKEILEKQQKELKETSPEKDP